MDTEKLRRGVACLALGALSGLLWLIASDDAPAKDTFGMAAFAAALIGLALIVGGLTTKPRD